MAEKKAKKHAPRIALVCDWLTTPGGAEKVLMELHEMYPKAPIYTSQYRPSKIGWFEEAVVHVGWLQLFPTGLRKMLGALRQVSFSHLDLTKYDLVISVTGAEAKSIKAKRHLCYCHVPTQYYWQMYDQYVKNPGVGILNPLMRCGLKALVKPLRKADYNAAQQPTQFITISHYAAQQIKQYYHRDAKVIAPPVEIERFQKEGKTGKFSTGFSTGTKYAVISCRQVSWKRIDLAIEACLQTKQPLLVIGDGPEHKRLLKLAKGSPLIKFLPWLEAEQLVPYLQHAEMFLFPSLEPFGIAAVEALAAGCPVIAYDEGGSRDFIQSERNGLLFTEQTAESLADAIKRFRKQKFNRETVTKSANKFSSQRFRKEIEREVTRLLKGKK